jgi:hypothetical protein
LENLMNNTQSNTPEYEYPPAVRAGDKYSR